MAFYHFGLADPTISENFRRAKRFAAMFIDEDSEAPNYDPEHNVFRSPIQTSVGPYNNSILQHTFVFQSYSPATLTYIFEIGSLCMWLLSSVVMFS